MMTNQERIALMRTRLEAALAPSQLDIIDESHLHKGHAGARTGKGHFALVITSPMFTGKTLVERHRLVYTALGELMDTEIHALKMECRVL